MGVSFGDAHGSAKKGELEYIKINFGENRFRLVGDLLPRYCYWKKLKDSNIPVECLAFDRKEERFTNAEKDWFKHYFPNEKCVWSYVIRVIDPTDGKLKLCGLKKKLFEQIQTAQKKLGDPTDIETGWDIIVEKKKTGPHVYNVEYTLQQLDLTPRPLTEAERELIKDMKSIDEVVPRLTAEQQKDFIENAWVNPQEEENVDDDAAKEVAEEVDDIPV